MKPTIRQLKAFLVDLGYDRENMIGQTYSELTDNMTEEGLNAACGF